MIWDRGTDEITAPQYYINETPNTKRLILREQNHNLDLMGTKIPLLN